GPELEPSPPVSCIPHPSPHFHANSSPVTFSNASIYLYRVLLITSAGSSGGLLFLSQPLFVSQSRTNCLSYDGCPRPGSYLSAGQNRELSGVMTSSIKM